MVKVIQGKVLRVIRSMYQRVKSCVRSCNNYSEFFQYAVGLRQGEVLSPILFSFFIEDLELYMQKNLDSFIEFDEMILILLLFADDMVIIGKSPEELQQSIDLLHNYCLEWNLEVNVQKIQSRCI